MTTESQSQDRPENSASLSCAPIGGGFISSLGPLEFWFRYETVGTTADELVAMKQGAVSWARQDELTRTFIIARDRLIAMKCQSGLRS